MPAVLYTPDIFSLQRVGGISRYFCELISRMPSRGIAVTTAAGIHLNQHLRHLPVNAGVYIPKLGPLGKYRLKFNESLCRRAAAKNPAVIIHLTYYSEAGFPESHPVVLTVYDMIDELFPGRKSAVPPGLKRHNCDRADHIIAISAVTKNDLIKLFHIPPEKISVVHLGASMSGGTDKPTGGNPYLLYVGVRNAYKNFSRFLEAFAVSSFLRREFDIISFGGGPFSEEERKQIERLKLDHKVRFAEGNDVALKSCYRNASALVFPSLYEGFGLPVLEAMEQNCPVICADAGSLPEIAADAAAYFDPLDVGNMQHVMEETLGNADRLGKLRRLGSARKELFSWDKCAQQTADVYRMLGRKTNPC